MARWWAWWRRLGWRSEVREGRSELGSPGGGGGSRKEARYIFIFRSGRVEGETHVTYDTLSLGFADVLCSSFAHLLFFFHPGLWFYRWWWCKRRGARKMGGGRNSPSLLESMVAGIRHLFFVLFASCCSWVVGRCHSQVIFQRLGLAVEVAQAIHTYLLRIPSGEERAWMDESHPSHHKKSRSW